MGTHSISKISNARRRYLRNHVVADPVRCHRQTCSLSTESKGVDLGRIQPGNTQRSHGERGEEDKEERHRHDAEFVRVSKTVLRKSQNEGDDCPAGGTGCGRYHHDFPATIALNDEIRHEREEEVVD